MDALKNLTSFAALSLASGVLCLSYADISIRPGFPHASDSQSECLVIPRAYYEAIESDGMHDNMIMLPFNFIFDGTDGSGGMYSFYIIKGGEPTDQTNLLFQYNEQEIKQRRLDATHQNRERIFLGNGVHEEFVGVIPLDKNTTVVSGGGRMLSMSFARYDVGGSGVVDLPPMSMCFRPSSIQFSDDIRFDASGDGGPELIMSDIKANVVFTIKAVGYGDKPIVDVVKENPDRRFRFRKIGDESVLALKLSPQFDSSRFPAYPNEWVRRSPQYYIYKYGRSNRESGYDEMENKFSQSPSAAIFRDSRSEIVFAAKDVPAVGAQLVHATSVSENVSAANDAPTVVVRQVHVVDIITENNTGIVRILNKLRRERFGNPSFNEQEQTLFLSPYEGCGVVPLIESYNTASRPEGFESISRDEFVRINHIPPSMNLSMRERYKIPVRRISSP